MPVFGTRSKANLLHVHKDLIKVAKEAIKITDFSVISGRRTPDEQFKLYKKGRALRGKKFVVVNKSKIVTYKDGYKKKSRHNLITSQALDIAPYPINWKDLKSFFYLAGVFIGCSELLYKQKEITHKIEWGGKWKHFKDYPHYQVKE